MSNYTNEFEQYETKDEADKRAIVLKQSIRASVTYRAEQLPNGKWGVLASEKGTPDSFVYKMRH